MSCCCCCRPVETNVLIIGHTNQARHEGCNQGSRFGNTNVLYVTPSCIDYARGRTYDYIHIDSGVRLSDQQANTLASLRTTGQWRVYR